MTGSQAPAPPQSWLSLQWPLWSLGSLHLKGQRSLSLFPSTEQRSDTFLGLSVPLLATSLLPSCLYLPRPFPGSLSALTPRSQSLPGYLKSSHI